MVEFRCKETVGLAIHSTMDHQISHITVINNEVREMATVKIRSLSHLQAGSHHQVWLGSYAALPLPLQELMDHGLPHHLTTLNLLLHMAIAPSLDKVHRAAMTSSMIVAEVAITEEILKEGSVKTRTEGSEGIMEDVNTRSSISICCWRMFRK